MKQIKTMLLATVALLGIVVSSHAQTYGMINLLNGGTRNVEANSTSNYTDTATLTKYEDVTLQLEFKNIHGSANSLCTFIFATSTDGTNYSTLNRPTIQGAFNGTTLVTINTNLTLGAAGYIRLISIQNACATSLYHATNVAVRVGYKPKRFGS